MPPKVSVIVPNYNHEKFLRERLESIFKQTYQDFEVILLDDCSTDNSVDILKEYAKHEKVSKVVLNPVNSGSPFRQWKKGIELANGEYIWIAESDDYADLQLLERFIPKLESGADLVYCRSMKVDEHGKRTNERYWPVYTYKKRWTSDFENGGKDEIRNYMAYRCPITNASGCIFRNKPIHFSDELLNSRFTGDWLFWIDYLKDSDLYYISDRLNYHRSHSSTTRSNKDIRSKLERLDERIRAIRRARRLCNMKRVRWREAKKYKYLFGALVKLKKEAGSMAVLKRIPADFIFYLYLYELNLYKHIFRSKLSQK